MQQGPAFEHIRTARANIRLASQICGGAADLARLQRALQLLEASATEMRLAEAAVRSGATGKPAELRREITQMKREIACTVRVIDGCASLHRGLSVRLGCTALTYTPQGRAVAPSHSAAACEMQG
jgi:hypothetical protein